VETISSPSKQAPRIFQTSPEHPNARIIINPPYGTSPSATKSRQPSGDIFDPQLPKKKVAVSAPAAEESNANARRSSRKRTQKVYDESTTEFSSDEEEPETKRRRNRMPSRRVSEPIPSSTTQQTTTTTTQGSPASETRKRKISIKFEPADSAPTKKLKEDKSRPQSSGGGSSAKLNREKEARLDRKENEELYEALQKQVTLDLLKRRYRFIFPANEGEFRLRIKKRW
jgi:hypothetical protein